MVSLHMSAERPRPGTLMFSRRSFRTTDFISRRPLSSLLFRTSSIMWERVSLGGLETSEDTRFKTGVTPIPSF
uniref:Uncharacterized protein n=1 Tax=Rhizophora mucronata TaxID=61149 RepID=A0A2P2NKQ6_RHIMU